MFFRRPQRVKRPSENKFLNQGQHHEQTFFRRPQSPAAARPAACPVGLRQIPIPARRHHRQG
ncbi:anti-sigma-factor antagonist [Neisseria bacilliformis ATCC BAA-1200]|uniref:Anti-sigma-factor antagonist n=1 Tax=Neisseria bacilliformis ATCC BAA-1200 TaxID=888742 RepID=F2BFW8_9NEIS|nr:anti-sigma-factor antagonist [Neisseria bacilliformis ATCC BAA-1200]